jgi:hypothetical protein
LPTTNLLTLPPDTNEDNHLVAALNPSSRSTPPAYPHVLILSAVGHKVAQTVAAAGDHERARRLGGC